MKRLPFFVCSFTLKGLNLERFLNTLRAQDIPLLQTERTETQALRCLCYESDLPAIEALAAEKGWKLEAISVRQLAAARAFLRRRWGLSVGFALMLVLLGVCSRFLWQVEITGAGAYLGDMRQFLMDSGVRPGLPMRAVDTAALEYQLYRRYPKIAWFTVSKRAMRLSVACNPGVPIPDNTMPEYGNLVASQDALVVDVQTHAGTAKVKPGELVKKGQVLIAGLERAAGDTTVAVMARGIVTARAWVQRAVSIPAFELSSARTGRSQEITRLSTPLFCMPETLESPPFLTYEREIMQRPLGGVFFPITVQRVKDSEVALEKKPRDIAAVQQEAGQAALRELQSAVHSNEIIDKWVDYCMIEGGKLTAVATAEIRLDIAVAQADTR